MSEEKKVYAGRKGTRSRSWSSHKAGMSSRRRPLNRFEMETDIEDVSASAKKLRQSTSACDVDINAEFGYRFINFVTVMNAIAQVVVCKTCGSDIKITESAIRGLAPKSTSSGKLLLDIASDIAVCTFNDGLSSVMQIMKVLDMTIGPNCYNFCLEVDALRIDRAEKSLSDAARDARSRAQSSRKTEEEENINLEGQLYGAGIAD